MKVQLSLSQVDNLAERLADKLRNFDSARYCETPLRVYAIPRGGIPAALAVRRYYDFELVEKPEFADIFIDDLIDSGETMQWYCDEYPETPFFALIDKAYNEEFKNFWIVFPWEVRKGGDESGTDIVTRLLQYVGEDPHREGLQETPLRVTAAWRHWCSGYGKDPKDILKVFEDGGETYDQMVTVKDIPIYSHCEHHLAPIFGTATISYIPDGKIVGLSKLSRLADMYARRLQVQERLTEQIADALHTHLEPKGVGVVIKARHLCMESRGICQQGHHTVTTALRGVLLSDADARAEFLRVAQ